MSDQSCPQCGYPNMNEPHETNCLHCGASGIIAATPNPDDHLCVTCVEKQQLVDVALAQALDLYDRAMLAMPRADFPGPGSPNVARIYLNQSLALMAKLSPAVQAHPTYVYWHDEVQSALAQLPQESEVEL